MACLCSVERQLTVSNIAILDGKTFECCLASLNTQCSCVFIKIAGIMGCFQSAIQDMLQWRSPQTTAYRCSPFTKFQLFSIDECFLRQQVNQRHGMDGVHFLPFNDSLRSSLVHQNTMESWLEATTCMIGNMSSFASSPSTLWDATFLPQFQPDFAKMYKRFKRVLPSCCWTSATPSRLFLQ